jgi:hypothetical protein
MVPEWGTLKSQQKAAVKGGRRPAKRTLEGCVLSHPRHLTMGLAGRPPKTEAGRRTVSIPPQIMARLERHLRSFVGADGSLPVLTGRKGGRLGRHPLNAAWQTARRQLGRPEIHFHDLRGAGLTWAATQGATTRELMAPRGACLCGCSSSLSTRGGGPGCSHRRCVVGARCIRRRGVGIGRGIFAG